MEKAEQFNTYKCWRPYLWTGDLLEWQSDSFIGHAIQYKTGKDVNHTGIVLRFMSFDKERVYTLEALGKGVYPNLVSRRLSNHKGKVFWLQLKPQYETYRPLIAKEALKYIGIKYDYGSLFKQLLSRVSVNADAFFCSELAYKAMEDAGLPINALYAPRPGDFHDLGIFRQRFRIF